MELITGRVILRGLNLNQNQFTFAIAVGQKFHFSIEGKSAGYRVLYYVKKETNIILATIYAKSDQTDIENKVIESIIEQFEREN